LKEESKFNRGMFSLNRDAVEHRYTGNVERSNPKLSLIIPAFNEEKRIEGTILSYLEYFSSELNNFEIIVEMDGCTDGTEEVVRKLAKKYANIIPIKFEKRLGKGGGIVRGFQNAKGDIVGFVDADGSIKPEEFEKLLIELENGYSGAIASRRAEGAVVVNQPLVRKILSKLFNILVRILFILPYKDTQCGAKIFRKKVIEEVIPSLNTHNFAFDVNLLYLITKKGFKIKEVGIRWEDKYGSKVKLHRVIPEMLISIIRLRLYHSPLKFLVRKE